MPEQKIIDRDTYRAIKKMSREELQAFLMRYADGLLEKDGKSIDLREVEKDLRQIKGIGDKRVEEIMAVFEKHLGIWTPTLALFQLCFPVAIRALIISPATHNHSISPQNIKSRMSRHVECVVLMSRNES